MWVAREENGLLRLYTKKPYRYVGGIWRIPNDGFCITISEEEYPQCKSITWEDEPIEIASLPKMMNVVQEKLAKSVDDYFNYVGYVQYIHPYSKEHDFHLFPNLKWEDESIEARKYAENKRLSWKDFLYQYIQNAYHGGFTKGINKLKEKLGWLS